MGYCIQSCLRLIHKEVVLDMNRVIILLSTFFQMQLADPDCFPADFNSHTWALSQSESGDVWFMALQGESLSFDDSVTACRQSCSGCSPASILNSVEDLAVQSILTR